MADKRRLRQRLTVLWRWVNDRLTRSLQLRIVVLTITLSALAIYGVGTYMIQQVSRGLYEAKIVALSSQTNSYAQEVQSLTIDANPDDALNTQLRSMIQRSPDRLRSISLEPRANASEVGTLSVVASPNGTLGPNELPTEFRDLVHQIDTDEQAYQALTVPGAPHTPGVVVAQSVSSPAVGDFALYVVADLEAEKTTLDFVKRSVLVAGLVLVVLVGAVGWIITRLVVVPVRTGAQVAREIADGNLDRRMRVKSQDEIGALAKSFNDMADSLQEKITRMEQLSVIQRQFASDVSHELRTPLTTIKAASELIYDGRDDFDEVTKRSAELLHSQVRRFEVLLSELLEISRYDAGAVRVRAEPTDVVDIVNSVAESLVALNQSHSEISVNARSTLVMAEVDGVRITRIVRNLLINAIEHGEDKPIQVEVNSSPEAVAISVRDHGVGLSPEQMEHIFDRFWRADPSRRRTLGGSGLGLAIALEDARLHGGWLHAWGELGEGACFRLTLPRREGSVITSSPLPLPPPDAAAGPAIVAGPSTSDGLVRVHTGALPLIIENGEISIQPYPGDANE